MRVDSCSLSMTSQAGYNSSLQEAFFQTSYVRAKCSKRIHLDSTNLQKFYAASPSHKASGKTSQGNTVVSHREFSQLELVYGIPLPACVYQATRTKLKDNLNVFTKILILNDKLAELFYKYKIEIDIILFLTFSPNDLISRSIVLIAQPLHLLVKSYIKHKRNYEKSVS